MAQRATYDGMPWSGDQHWYREPVGKPVHDRVVPYARTLVQASSKWHRKNVARERIYEGIELDQFSGAIRSLERVGMGIAKLNAIKSIVDTFVSRLTKDRPMPSFVTDDADWYLKRKAKQFRKFIVGQMLETEFDDLSRRGADDAAVFGNGFTRIDDGDDDVYAERMHLNEVLFDWRECRYGKPQQAIHWRRVARDYLCELFPKFGAEIMRCPNSMKRYDDNYDDESVGDLSDYVDLYTAWHLPVTPDSSDGRVVLAIEHATLYSEEWCEPRFPWVHWRLADPRRGLMGRGFVDDLADIQHRVNCIVRDIQLNLTATGRGHFLVNAANDIPVEMLSGWQPFKLTYNGPTPPQWVAPTPINPSQLNMLEFFITKMYDLSGVSRANAESRSQLGAGASGVALDTQYDIDSDRFRKVQGNYARGRLDGARCYLDAAGRVSRKREENKGKKRSYVAVSWRRRDAIERLDYDQVAMKRDQYRLQIEPVNFLPDTRAGKLSVVEQLSKAGVIPQWLVPTLFDEPDLVQANGIMLATFHNTMRKMDELADEDVPMPQPEPLNDLDLEIKIVTAYYNRVQNELAPEEIQARYRDYANLVIDAQDKVKQAAAALAPPAPPMAPAEQPMPGGVPAMPVGPVPAPEMIGAAA